MKTSVPRLLLIGDFGKDLDDEHALLVAARLHHLGTAQLIGVIANLEPALERARLAKGILELLNLKHVPVAVGTACFSDGIIDAHETDVPYLAHPSELWGNGLDLIRQTLENADAQSITLVLNSGLTDAAEALRAFPHLMKDKLVHVTIMGGITLNATGEPSLSPDDFLEPSLGKNGAANNCFDEPSARYAYHRFQELGVPMTILTRYAAYGCAIPYAFCSELAQTGHPIGIALERRQPFRYTDLWQAVHAPIGSPLRGALPLDRTPAWFLHRYCDDTCSVRADEPIEAHMKNIHLYDPLAVVAAIPKLRDRFYRCTSHVVLGTKHRIIGLNAQQTDIKNPTALRNFIKKTELAALQSA